MGWWVKLFLGGSYQIEFYSVEGKVRFLKIMKNAEAKKRLELKEFVSEYQQICVTRVPADFPDINIRVAIERLGEIRIEAKKLVCNLFQNKSLFSVSLLGYFSN